MAFTKKLSDRKMHGTISQTCVGSGDQKTLKFKPRLPQWTVAVSMTSKFTAETVYRIIDNDDITTSIQFL